MKKRTVIKLILIAAAVLMLAACNVGEIYDDDARIAKKGDNTSSTLVSENTINSNYKISAKSFSGVKTVKSGITLSANSALNGNLEIKSGKFKVVLVGTDGTVHTVTEESFTNRIETKAAAGKYDLKIVGQKGEMVLSLDLSNFS